MRKGIFTIISVPLIALGCNYAAMNTKSDEETGHHPGKPVIAMNNDSLEKIQIPEVPNDYINKNLNEYGIKASIKVPKTVKVYKSIINDNEGERDYVVIHLVESFNKKLEIIPTGYTMKSLLNNFELSEGLYYKTTKLVEDSNTVIFESEYKGDTKEYNKHVYNFLIRIELDGKAYFMTTDSHQEFTSEEYAYKKEDVLKLYSIAKSIVEKK